MMQSGGGGISSRASRTSRPLTPKSHTPASDARVRPRRGAPLPANSMVAPDHLTVIITTRACRLPVGRTVHAEVRLSPRGPESSRRAEKGCPF
jgi:hypothetical protein